MRIHHLLRNFKVGVICEATVNDGGDKKRRGGIVNTSHEFMTKIHQMADGKGDEGRRIFKETIKNLSLYTDDNGYLDLDAIPNGVQEKIDGYTVRIVAMRDGRVGVESSSSGVVFDSTLVKLGGFKNLIEFFQQPRNAKRLTKLANDVGYDVKILGELLAVNVFAGKSKAEMCDADGSISFVTTAYDPNKFGEMGGVIFWGLRYITEDDVIKAPDKVTKSVLATVHKFSDPEYFTVEGTERMTWHGKLQIIRPENRELQMLFDNPELVDKMATRKKSGEDYEIKQACIVARQQLADNFTTAMREAGGSHFKVDGSNNPNSEVEGLVFNINGMTYGAQNSYWKKQKEKNDSFGLRVDEVITKFFRDVWGVNSRSAAMQKFIDASDEELEAATERYIDILPRFQAELEDARDAFINDGGVMSKNFKAIQLNVLDRKVQRYFELTPDFESLKVLVVGQPVDPERIRNSDKITCAVVPGSFKPPHKGHYDMVRQYSEMVGERGKVVVVVSDP